MEVNQLPSVLIHIGFHKTATSFLQAKLFASKQLGFYQYPRKRANKLIHGQLTRLGAFNYLTKDTISGLHNMKFPKIYKLIREKIVWYNI